MWDQVLEDEMLDFRLQGDDIVITTSTGTIYL